LVLEDPLGAAVDEPEAGRPRGEGAEFGARGVEGHGGSEAVWGAGIMRANGVNWKGGVWHGCYRSAQHHYPKRVRLVIFALGFLRVSVGHHEGWCV
jgi:hypothetical protein